ncbi:MAG TPA: acyl-CoA dehydrogenase family protein [Solirubrobacteraceae bacterium]|nr:acyl-CoA dehydrogenase family protein [Solirubrobacteraceae bacterium]
MSVTVESDRTLLADVARIAAEVAAPAADAVDHEARFPIEAITALREAHALSAAVPEELGGGGATLEAVARSCFELGRSCSAAAMVFAMHQIQVITIARHLDGAPWFESYLRRLAAEQRLVASVTSEIGTGGDMARSIAAVTEEEHDVRSFEKKAPTVSYGAHADDLFTTVRRNGDAEPGDQVLVLSTAGQAELEPTGVWNTLGMRGTCSPGFVVRARFAPEQILAAPFSTVMNQSLVPVSHILWSHVWLGIATEAFERARAFVRSSARQRPGEPLPAAHRLSNVMAELTLLRSEVAQGLQDFTSEDEESGRERLLTMASILRFNNLKLAASEHTPRVCEGALEVIGILGYRNDGPYSVGRHLRDALSARLMVANERIHTTDAALLLIAKEA